MVQALENRDFASYLALVTESGSSSFRYLQNIYSPASASEQGIALAYAMTESFLDSCACNGAFRVQGGGFAGTLEAYIPIERTADYFSHMEKLFGQGCCTVLAIRNLPTTRIR